jgi:hypothetical protein
LSVHLAILHHLLAGCVIVFIGISLLLGEICPPSFKLLEKSVEILL